MTSHSVDYDPVGRVARVHRCLDEEACRVPHVPLPGLVHQLTAFQLAAGVAEPDPDWIGQEVRRALAGWSLFSTDALPKSVAEPGSVGNSTTSTVPALNRPAVRDERFSSGASLSADEPAGSHGWGRQEFADGAPAQPVSPAVLPSVPRRRRGRHGRGARRPEHPR